MKVLVAGIIARYPFGGVTWCSLMYLLGLRALGHEVLYIEDTGECIYDPERNTLSEDPSYGTRYINDALAPFGLGDRWSFVNFNGEYHGVSREGVRAFCADADLFVNLSGGSWFWRDEYVKIPRRVFIDSDPVFTQLAIAKAEGWYVDFFKGFDHLFTFGANIGTPGNTIPTSGFTWHRTWQPVMTDLWQSDAPPAGDRFTTVMTWKIESFSDVDGNKDIEFRKFIDLPQRTSAPLRAGGQRPPRPAARARLGHGECDGRVEVVVGLPHVHPGVARRVRGGQARLRQLLFRLVQRSDRVLSRRRASGTGAGHRLEHPSANGRRTAAVLELRGGARRARSDRRRLDDAFETGHGDRS